MGLITFENKGLAQTAKPIFVLRGNAPMSIKDYLPIDGIHVRLAHIDPSTGIFELRVARDKRASQPLLALEVATDVPRSDYIVLRPKFSRHQLILVRIHSNDGRLVDGLVGALQ